MVGDEEKRGRAREKDEGVSLARFFFFFFSSLVPNYREPGTVYEVPRKKVIIAVLL